MNKLITILALSAAMAFGQTALTQTTTSTAMLISDQAITVASATGISARTWLYVVDPGNQVGEIMQVSPSYSSGTRIPVLRGVRGAQFAHVSGAVAIIAPYGDAFRNTNPYGSCSAATTGYTPQINTQTGEQWLCSTVTLSWVPGWNNSAAKASTATVASAAGLLTPSGPLFTVSGTAAITGITAPVGFTNSGGFCIVPSGAFTWTTANNIAVAGTAVVGRLLCFQYSATTSKYVASYL